jgi:hypothetical protein
MEHEIQKTIIPKDEDLPTVEVTFEAEVEQVDNSFDHAFGTEKRTDYECQAITWNKHVHTEIENQLIYEWLLENQSYLEMEFEELML